MRTLLSILAVVWPFAVVTVVIAAAIRSLMNPRNKPRSSAGIAGAFGVLEDIYNPAAERTRLEREAQKERVVPMPSAGAPELRDGEMVIELKSSPKQRKD